MIAALLHVITPAGLFMSAPYGESLTSFLSFSGMLCYCRDSASTMGKAHASPVGEVWTVLAGLCFGLASTVRSNGVLNGLIFLQDFLSLTSKILNDGIDIQKSRQSIAIITGGCLVAIGFALPQTIAYIEYCSGNETRQNQRPWCSQMPPSVYIFVQSFYW